MHRNENTKNHRLFYEVKLKARMQSNKNIPKIIFSAESASWIFPKQICPNLALFSIHKFV